jgi:hypothetical protein
MRYEGYQALSGARSAAGAKVNYAVGDGWEISMFWWNLLENNLAEECAYGVSMCHGGMFDDSWDRSRLWPGSLGNIVRQNTIKDARLIGVSCGVQDRKNSPRLKKPIRMLVGTIIEMNHIVDAQIAFHVDEHCDGVVIRRNEFFDWHSPERHPMVRVEKGALNVTVQTNAYEFKKWTHPKTEVGICQYNMPRLPTELHIGEPQGGWEITGEEKENAK